MLVFRRDRFPVVGSVELATGVRSAYLTIVPADRSGLLGIGNIELRDRQRYACDITRNRNRLFTMRAVRW